MEEHRADHGMGASSSTGKTVDVAPPLEEAGEQEPPAEVEVEAEIQEGLQFLAANGYPLDDTALAMLHGGVAAGYAVYLQSLSDDDLVITPRTWAQKPDSKEYKRRLGFFRQSMLEAIRANEGTPLKGLVTGPFEDCAPNEEPPQGVLS